MAHRFHFFRAGGVDQVSLRDGKDVAALRELDPKLWVALAMPTTGVDLDAATLALLDTDKDGRVRKDDVLGAVAWIGKTFTDGGDVLKSVTSVKLAQIADKKVLATAKRMLADLGKATETSISIGDVEKVAKEQLDSKLNGDGIVTATSTDDAEVARAITDVIATIGTVVDRSGKPGVNSDQVTAFFADVDKHAAWVAAKVDVIGDATTAAADAVVAVRGKIEDYFTRCAVAAYDARGNTALAGAEADLAALSTRSLSATDEEIAKLPLSHIAATMPARLTMVDGLNPSWAAKIAAFRSAAVASLIGARDALTAADLALLVEKLAPFEAWRAAKPVTKVGELDPAWLATLAKPELRAKLARLIVDDAALADEYAEVSSVEKMVRFQRDFGRLLRNFVNFSDFYGENRDGIFQAGHLYLDARAMHLTVPVTDAGKHAALAGSSDAYLAYCDISRLGEKSQIAVAITNGDADNVFVGRNGVFYDRKGQDWDATVAKIVGNPISIREAFWTPYKKLVKVIEENITKRAQAADAKSTEKIEATGAGVVAVHVEPPKQAEPPAKKIDLGTIAALGVAIGGIGTLFGMVLGTLFGLGPWLPIGVIAILLLISGPSMLLAWLKLRRRNLGPILDANGWAINGRAKINVAFGAALTELAKLPKDSARSLKDPFEDKKTPWKRWVFLFVLIVLAALWFVGRLDRYIPWKAIRSVSVLGDKAPAYVAPAPTPGAAAGSGSALPAPAPPVVPAGSAK